MVRKAIKCLTPVAKKPAKPLFEGNKNQKYTPDWDGISGLGQRHKEVVERYGREFPTHLHMRNGTKRPKDN